MPSHYPSNSVAAGVLREQWSIAAEPERVAAGASRSTWYVDHRFWLSHSDLTEDAVFRREAQLLEALSRLLAERNVPWCVPSLVRTRTGEAIAAASGGVWRLAQHVPGEQPNMQEAGTYLKLARMLAELHALLESAPHTLAVRDCGAVERARTFVDAYQRSSFHPATRDPREVHSLEAIVRWLAPRLGEVEALPRQLTHGDWTPPNIKVTEQGWGVLDWEFARVDPVVMDLAQSCSTILMWSGLSGPAELISQFVESYRAHSGRRISLEHVRAAMVVYWLQNYFHWRARQEAVGGFEGVLAHQPGRLHTIAEFVGAR